MVLVKRQRDEVVRGRELEAPLGVYRLAAGLLPDRAESLLDRLFALECLANAGREATAERMGLLPSLGTAEEMLDSWEPDAVHIAALGQALSTRKSLDRDSPQEWAVLLQESLDEALKGEGRFGVASTHALLASVMRGLAVIDAKPAPALVRATETLVDQGGRVVGMADLAEALSRHRATSALAERLSTAVFSDARSEEDGVAIVRWWLSERWKSLCGEDAPGATESVLEMARTQALISTPSTGGSRLAAMLAEVAGRNIGNLVLISSSKLQELRAQDRVRSMAENLIWRALALVAGTVFVVVYLAQIAGKLGLTPTASTLRIFAALLIAVAGFFVAEMAKAGYRLTGRAAPQSVDNFVTLFLPGLGVLLSILLYSP